MDILSDFLDSSRLFIGGIIYGISTSFVELYRKVLHEYIASVILMERKQMFFKFEEVNETQLFFSPP